MNEHVFFFRVAIIFSSPYSGQFSPLSEHRGFLVPSSFLSVVVVLEMRPSESPFPFFDKRLSRGNVSRALHRFLLIDWILPPGAGGVSVAPSPHPGLPVAAHAFV